MPIHSFRPLTPSGRFTSLNKQTGLSKERPQRALTESKHKTGGRNVYGRVTSRHRGGGHKQLYRIVDFKRNLLDLPARVQAIEYDPNRTANLALIAYATGEKRYILAPEGLKVGATIVTSNKATTNDFLVGNNFPLELIPPSTLVHAVELVPGRGAQIARAAGTSLELIAVENGQAQLKMPSGELRLVHPSCRATIGVLGNGDHNKQSLGKAGRKRWLGRRPHVRGVAMNPVDHPMGGGEGRTSGGRHPCSPTGKLAKGGKTRRRRKPSNSAIIRRRRSVRYGQLKI
jgi:large subunit ribosomal protein L2